MTEVNAERRFERLVDAEDYLRNEGFRLENEKSGRWLSKDGLVDAYIKQGFDFFRIDYFA